MSLPTIDEIAESLKKHIEINSVFPEEMKYGSFLEKKLLEIDFDVERHDVEDQRFNLTAEKGKGDKIVCFYGHLDTVPVYGDWSGDPFEAWRENGKLYGLGSCDMKGGNLAILEAVKNIPEDVKVKLAFGVDEEYMSKGSTALAETDFFDDADIVIVPEVGDKNSHDQIALGRRGRISIDVTIIGESAHAAHPEKGESALVNAASLIQEIKQIDLGTDPDMGEADLTIRSLKSDAGALSIPEEAEMIIDRHMVPGETVQDCLEQIENAAKSAEVDVDVKLRDRPTPYLKPYKTEEDEVKEFIDIVEQLHGDHKTIYGDSVADENRIAELNVPVVTYGPIGVNEHAPDEEVELESIRQLIKTYNRFLDNKSS